ncbi:MAG: host attachment family protein [Rhodanobacter sp.]
MNKIPAGTWVVVADGTQARMLRNVGTDATLSLKQDRLLQPKDLLNDGPAGRQPPERSEAAMDEATFAKQLAKRLNAAALNDEFAHLLLVADPRTLGEMRPLLHQEASKRVVGEINKTLTGATLEDIERALR